MALGVAPLGCNVTLTVAIIEPEITAKYVSLSPLVVLLATAIGGVVAGLVGLLLAVPAAAILSKAVSLIRQVDDPTRAEVAQAT